MFGSFGAFIVFMFTVIKWILILIWAIIWTLITSKVFWIMLGIILVINSLGLLKGVARGSLGILSVLASILGGVGSFIEHVCGFLGLSILFSRNK